MAALKKQKKVTALKTAVTHPFTVQVGDHHPVVNPPRMVESMKAAKTFLHKQVSDFEARMKIYDGRVTFTCANIHGRIDAISEEGGSVDELLDPHSNSRFRATVRPS